MTTVITRPGEPSRFIPSALGATIVLSVILRLVSAFLQGDAVAPLPGVFDQISYDELARRVLAGYGFTFPIAWWPATRPNEPTAHWSFLYTLYLTAVYALFGPHPLAARFAQALVAGVLHPWLSWRIGLRLFGAPTGLVAAGLSALYPYFVYYAGSLMTETLYILAVLWAFDLAIGIVQGRRSWPWASRPSRRSRLQALGPWFLLGMALGIGVLLRQVLLLFVPFLFAWLVWSLSSIRASSESASARVSGKWMAAGLLITTAVLFTSILPWTARNYQQFGRFVLLNTNSGYAFFWANHPVHGTDFVPILGGSLYHDLIPPDLLSLDEAAMDQALLQRGLAFVVNDPVRYARLSFSRIRDYFQFWPSPESSLPSNLARSFSSGLAMPFVLYGLFLALSRRRRVISNGQQQAVVLLGLFVIVYSAIHLLSWALIRYRLPVDAVLLQFAALAIVCLEVRLPARLRRYLTSRRDRTVPLPDAVHDR